MKAELELFLNWVIEWIVDNGVSSQIVSLEGNNTLETGDFSSFSAQRKEPDKRIDKLLFTGQNW